MNQKIYNAILAISLIALSSAFFIEYVLGHQPCNLCILERVPYVLSALIILSYYKFNFKEANLIKILIIIFVSGSILSVYHFGIEQGLIEESFVCSASDNVTLNKEQLLKELQKMTISCKNVTFRILGLSLTTYNILLSVIITAILLRIYVKQK